MIAEFINFYETLKGKKQITGLCQLTLDARFGVKI